MEPKRCATATAFRRALEDSGVEGMPLTSWMDHTQQTIHYLYGATHVNAQNHWFPTRRFRRCEQLQGSPLTFVKTVYWLSALQPELCLAESRID
jgi:hypothetical protein